jgi:hypothetical protein
MTLEEMMKDINRNAEDWLNAGDVARAVERGTDEFGRPNLVPFTPEAMRPLPDPPVSIADQGLRTTYGPGNLDVPGEHIGGTMGADLRPSTNVEDRRGSTTILKRDWLSDALDTAMTNSEAVKPELGEYMQGMRVPKER